jgi:hypothetical protein
MDNWTIVPPFDETERYVRDALDFAALTAPQHAGIPGATVYSSADRIDSALQGCSGGPGMATARGTVLGWVSFGAKRQKVVPRPCHPTSRWNTLD